METPNTNTPEAKICSNCGTSVTDNFCPHCGKQANIDPRLHLLPFVKESLQSLFKMNSGFFHTYFMLCTRPWIVIKDFIHGKRSCYTPPVRMLLSLLIYIAIFYSIFDINDHSIMLTIDATSDRTENEIGVFGYKFLTLFLRIINSQEFAYMIICPPIILTVYLIYFKFGSRRFNMAEYLVATIYMLCSFVCYDLIHLVFAIFGVSTHNIDTLIPVIITAIALTKAFYVRNLVIRLLLLLAVMVLIAPIIFGSLYLFSVIINFII